MKLNFDKLIQKCTTVSLWLETSELQESWTAMGCFHPNNSQCWCSSERLSDCRDHEVSHGSFGLGQKQPFSHELAPCSQYILPVQHFQNTPSLHQHISLILGEDKFWGLCFLSLFAVQPYNWRGVVAMQRHKQGYAQKFQVWSLTAFELSLWTLNLLQDASLCLTVPLVLGPTTFHSALWRLQGDGLSNRQPCWVQKKMHSETKGWESCLFLWFLANFP